MRRLSFIMLALILPAVLFNYRVYAEIFPGIEFPKIIYGDPMVKYYEGWYHYPEQLSSADWDVIDEVGFNVILSDVDADNQQYPEAFVLDPSYNQYPIQVMLRPVRIGNDIAKYMRSTYISRNIIEDEYYNPNNVVGQQYPGWSPR